MNPTAELGCRYRPEWHYAAERNWLNDPNGLVYSNGVYHLFYQHNPRGDVWGNMSWGHATSADLLTWDEQPVAIPCDEQEAIFSGSAVVKTRKEPEPGGASRPPSFRSWPVRRAMAGALSTISTRVPRARASGARTNA